MALSDLVDRLAIVLRAELRRVAAEHGLVPVQLEALRYLASCNRYSDTPSAVAEFLGATPGTVSQTLLALERKGLVAKEPDARDARKVHCRPTEAGLALLAEITVHRAAPELGANAERALRDLLAGLQRARGYRTFGECRTCRHHERGGPSGRCGLTGEPLAEEDAARICLEHTPC